MSAAALLPFGSMSDASARKPTPLGQRLQEALDAEGRKQTSVEVALKAKGIVANRGQLSRFLHGTRGSKTIKPEMWAAIADELRVNFEWLVLGRGPMRPVGHTDTPFDEAVVFARQNGAREDAIELAKARHGDKPMTTAQWVVAIDEEARMLDRAGIPRPEVVREKQEQIERAKRKKNRTETSTTPPAAPSPSERAITTKAPRRKTA